MRASIVNQSGLVIQDNPDLLPHQLLVKGNDAQLQALAGWDEVAYIFPASDRTDCAAIRCTRAPEH